MSNTDGPFGDFGNIGVGFSDTAILAVSLVGFCFLGFTVYNIVVLRLKTREEIEKEDEATAADYEARLVRSNVAGLSRAERRARARAIMKQQRRVQPPRQNEQQRGDQDGGEQQQAVEIVLDADHDSDTEEDRTSRLSRKERQRVAKALEKEERKAMGDERKQQQKELEDIAKKDKREREKRQAIELEKERAEQRRLKVAAELERQSAWETFLSTKSCSLSVNQWIEEIQSNQSVSIDDIASRFDVSSDRVLARIDELVDEKRVAGVVTMTGRFIYISQQNIDKIMEEIEAKAIVSDSEIATICNSIVLGTGPLD
eukprot:CAMPEP_0172444286 /NCGR_PEP_ID=MMETSP1065-20121228/4339_1 /TAXON_ID=265537 /ORGANISM="Amphiprora paludosa, Strain CCMP125" /LENGTH=314 /DNA_ID=CAMNT_0013194753 /DNA_START=98 /DNA_END=1042 /DNA_ORIENTATION=+